MHWGLRISLFASSPPSVEMAACNVMQRESPMTHPDSFQPSAPTGWCLLASLITVFTVSSVMAQDGGPHSDPTVAHWADDNGDDQPDNAPDNAPDNEQGNQPDNNPGNGPDDRDGGQPNDWTRNIATFPGGEGQTTDAAPEMTPPPVQNSIQNSGSQTASAPGMADADGSSGAGNAAFPDTNPDTNPSINSSPNSGPFGHPAGMDAVSPGGAPQRTEEPGLWGQSTEEPGTTEEPGHPEPGHPEMGQTGTAAFPVDMTSTPANALHGSNTPAFPIGARGAEVSTVPEATPEITPEITLPGGEANTWETQAGLPPTLPETDAPDDVVIPPNDAAAMASLPEAPTAVDFSNTGFSTDPMLAPQGAQPNAPSDLTAQDFANFRMKKPLTLDGVGERNPSDLDLLNLDAAEVMLLEQLALDGPIAAQGARVFLEKTQENVNKILQNYSGENRAQLREPILKMNESFAQIEHALKMLEEAYAEIFSKKRVAGEVNRQLREKPTTLGIVERLTRLLTQKRDAMLSKNTAEKG